MEVTFHLAGGCNKILSSYLLRHLVWSLTSQGCSLTKLEPIPRTIVPRTLLPIGLVLSSTARSFIIYGVPT